MKRYNLSMIMKQAWRSYRLGGKTFSEALKSAWNLAKLQVRMESMLEKKPKEVVVKKREIDTNSVFNRLDIPTEAFYSNNNRGYLGSHYVGD